MRTSRLSVGTLGLAAVIGAAALSGAEPAPPEYTRIKDLAEASYAEGSFARAHTLYTQAAELAAEPGLQLAPEETRWVAFRIADTRWRARAGSRTHDNTIFEKARRELEAVIREFERPEDRDRVWAEAHESLGDFWWARRGSQNWSQGWQHYQHALDFWAGTHDLQLARRRYLDMVWRMAAPQWRRHHGWYGYHNIPLNILENARTIARRPEDQARAHYLLAMGLRQYGGAWPQRQRIEGEFEAALQFGTKNPWYDDALYHYAQWLAQRGRITVTPDGQWRQEPDYVEAVALYRRLVRELGKGETRYFDDANNQIKQITQPQLSATVSNIFLPGSEVRFDLNWRNLKTIELALHRVDLTRDVDPSAGERQLREWIWNLDPTAGEKVKSWSVQTKDTGEHKSGHEGVRLEEPLPVGAYLLLATGGGKTARELVLVTDVSVVLKSFNGEVLAYVCDALDGSPIPGARVRLWNYRYLDKRWTGTDQVAKTDRQGLCRFTVNTQTRSRERYYGFLVTASAGDRQAFSTGARFSRASRARSWKIYASTDRPAYRPGEAVQWKITARTNDGSGYATPQERIVAYEIAGPRGKIDEGELTLNAFGSAWSRLELSESMALGEYQISFWTSERRRAIGNAQLFRLEEYKLPEFEVAVTTPRDDEGRKKTFRVGEPVEVTIEADYYFGGPVANANVAVLVYQKPFYHHWMPPRDYPWYYGQRSSYYWGGPGQIIKQETLKTNGAGRVTLTFDTPVGGRQDFEYRIEARVTDASRREIVGADTVRVTRQRYYVYPRPKHNLYRPGDKVEIDFKTLDANDEPVSVTGTVKVTRERWIEVWLDPAGREVTGRALENARRRLKVFPPPVKGDTAPWRLKFRGYTPQDILTKKLTTDAEGEATLAFTAKTDGYYRIAWRSVPPRKGDPTAPITAEAMVWVADRATTDLGYRQGGVQIIVDKDTFRAGQTAAVMLSVPTNDRYVLFTVEGNDLHHYEIVHVTGTVKLVSLPISERHIPNVYLNALMVSDGQIFVDRKDVVVPPVENFLEIEVTADRDTYEPQDEGLLTVTARDVDGRPVVAEVSLSLVDESVYYIQQDYAPDPREFFFNDRQGSHIVRTTSTFNHKSYVKLVELDEDQLIDARLVLGDDKDGRFDHLKRTVNRREAGEIRARGFGGGGIYADADGDASPYSAMAMEMSNEAVTTPAAVPPGVPGPANREGGRDQPGAEPAVVVRSDFRSTIFWQPDLVTDQDGTVTVSIKYADSLTRWKATARAATQGNQFGIGGTTTRTRRPLIARLQGPRFFVVGDTVTLSGIFNNNTDKPMTVRPSLEVEGLNITGVIKDGRPVSGRAASVEIPAGSQARVDWLAVVEQPGEAKIVLTARSRTYADAMERTYPVHEHGIEKFIAKSGKVRSDAVTVILDIPAEREAGSTTLTVGVTSSMAVTMLDALPYLVDYPYGCTEQTMSRFLPMVVTARTLQDLGLSPEDALGKVFGGIERQFVDKTQDKGRENRKNLKKMTAIAEQGLGRLYDFQHSDGGWGWWKGGESDHFMTAYVLWGMCLARQAGLDVRLDVAARAALYLDLEIVEAEGNADVAAWMLHALAAYHATSGEQAIGPHQRQAIENLWKNRNHLNAYTRALFALAVNDYGLEHKARVLVRNLENGVKRDAAPDTSILLGRGQRSQPAVIGTAHWGEDGMFWRWSSGGVEATAFALRAILAIDPENELIEPVTNWLIKNRRGAQWSNTRDTAITVLALNDYLRLSGELEPQLEYELLVNGTSIARKTITAAEALSAPSRFTIDPELIRDGANTIEIRRKGKGPIYFTVEASFFSLEEPVPPAGNEIFVRRDYYKLVPRETLLKGYVYDRVALADGDYVTSGERVEVVVTIEAKNNYEYLVFEDLKPAGLEAVQIRSGESIFVRELKSGAVDRRFAADGDPAGPAVRAPANDFRMGHPGGGAGDGTDYTGRRRWVHQELRDRKVVLFIDKLPEGVWEIGYDLRAEVPGHFHALPVLGHAMYVPEIRCNSGELRITVSDRDAGGAVVMGE